MTYIHSRLRLEAPKALAWIRIYSPGKREDATESTRYVHHPCSQPEERTIVVQMTYQKSKEMLGKS